MWRCQEGFGSFEVLYSSPIVIVKLFRMPVERFFSTGCTVGVSLVVYDLVLDIGSPPVQFGGGCLYECYRFLVDLLCRL